MLKNKYDRSRINNACKRALRKVLVYAMVRSAISSKGIGLRKLDLFTTITPLPDHENIRGPLQFQ